MFRVLTLASLTFAIALYSNVVSLPAVTSVAISSEKESGAPRRSYGSPVRLGDGHVRSYVEFGREGNQVPVEVGVAFDESAMEGLPASGSGHHDGHMETHEFILELPAKHNTPIRFVELNWNPSGHEPEGVYLDVPHFDFHFYTVAKAERDAIVPTNPQFAKEADNIPVGDFVPPFTAPLGPPGVPPSGIAVPKMGVHWVDLRSQELQGILGKPEAFKPFTTTFIYGSWNGKFHFLEPMITRAYLLEKKTTKDAGVRDETIAIPVPARYADPGYYPTAYRITWDEQSREYRVALTKLEKRD